MTGLWPEGCGGGFAADYKKGARLRRRLCRRVVSPQGKRLTMICASLALLQIMFAVHRFAQGATALRAEGCGLPLRAMSFIIPPSAVTSTSSIIIILTLVHPFATSWPSSPKGDARTLRDWLSVSYVTQYPVPPIFSFPLEGKSREAGKGVRGRAPIGCSIAVLTANRRPP